MCLLEGENSMLKITEAGRAKCASLEFAEKFRIFILECEEKGVEKKHEETMAILSVTSALTEGSVDTRPTIDDILRFAGEHRREIDATIAKVLDTLTIHCSMDSQCN
jgi:hypothetical protein